MVKEIKLSNCIISENNYPFIIAEMATTTMEILQLQKN